MATVKIIETDEDFISLKKEWDSILSNKRNVRIFQTFDWNYFAWTVYHRREFTNSRLFLLHCTRDGHRDQRAILPLCITDNGTLHFIGQNISDVLDIIVPEHEDNWHSFYKDIVKFLSEADAVKEIDFHKLEGDSEFLQYLTVYMGNAEVLRMDSYSYLPVKRTDDFPGSLSHLTSKERSYIRSLSRKYSECEYKTISLRNGDVYPKSEMTHLRDLMCALKMREKSFMPDAAIELLESIYNAGKCDISILCRDGIPVEMSTRLYADAIINFWIVLYEEPAMTTVVDARYMAERAAVADCVFDFGTGAYAYKLGSYRPLVRNLYRFKARNLSFINYVKDIWAVNRLYIKGTIEHSSPRLVTLIKDMRRMMRQLGALIRRG